MRGTRFRLRAPTGQHRATVSDRTRRRPSYDGSAFRRSPHECRSSSTVWGARSGPLAGANARAAPRRDHLGAVSGSRGLATPCRRWDEGSFRTTTGRRVSSPLLVVIRWRADRQTGLLEGEQPRGVRRRYHQRRAAGGLVQRDVPDVPGGAEGVSGESERHESNGGWRTRDGSREARTTTGELRDRASKRPGEPIVTSATHVRLAPGLRHRIVVGALLEEAGGREDVPLPGEVRR